MYGDGISSAGFIVLGKFLRESKSEKEAFLRNDL